MLWNSSARVTPETICDFFLLWINCFVLFLVKESCLILLQTIPDHINIDCLCKQLMKEFPDIINVHDLHVWQFTKGKTFFTAHIIFLNPKVMFNYIDNEYRKQLWMELKFNRILNTWQNSFFAWMIFFGKLEKSKKFEKLDEKWWKWFFFSKH